MKNLKIVFATLLVAVLGIAVSSFTVKSYNSRAFAVVCYELKPAVPINTGTFNAPTQQIILILKILATGH